MTAESPAKKEKLESWKEIAAYLNRDVRTVRRWEKDRALPVRRFPGTRPRVWALVSEIDDWRDNGARARPGIETATGSAPASTLPKSKPAGWPVVAASVSVITVASMAIFWATPAARSGRTPRLHMTVGSKDVCCAGARRFSTYPKTGAG